VQVHARSGNEHAAAINSFFYVEQRGFPIPVLALRSYLRRIKGSENTLCVQKRCSAQTHAAMSSCHCFLGQHMRELNLDKRHRLCKKRAASVMYLRALVLEK
jgi:hypothetical protein